MKRRIAFLLTLLMIASLLPVTVSEAGKTDLAVVTVNGKTRYLDWDDLYTKDGEMKISVTGFEKKDKGEDFGMLGIIAGGKEIKAKKAEDDGNGHCIYYFDNSAMPDAVFLYTNDDSNRRILIWKTFDFAGAPQECVGQWKGTVDPKDGGEKFKVTATIDFDGQGRFKYMREDSGGMLPFEAKFTDKKFTAKVANGVLYVTAMKGTWKISKGKLKLKVTMTYRDGNKETFNVTLKKVEEETEE